MALEQAIQDIDRTQLAGCGGTFNQYRRSTAGSDDMLLWEDKSIDLGRSGRSHLACCQLVHCAHDFDAPSLNRFGDDGLRGRNT